MERVSYNRGLANNLAVTVQDGLGRGRAMGDVGIGEGPREGLDEEEMWRQGEGGAIGGSGV